MSEWGILESEDDIFLQEDLDAIANSECSQQMFRNKTVLVTGATGFIGSLLIKALQCCNRRKCLNIRIIALVRSKEKAKKIFGRLLECKNIVLVQGDITESVVIEEEIQYIIHCASITASKDMVNKPAEVVRTAVEGTYHILELAKNKNLESMVYLSSMEVYGSFKEDGRRISEEMMGYLDPLEIRSNYPESKKLCENMCVAYAKEYGVPVKIARLAQTFGAGIIPGENRVFAQFARSAIEGKDIVLHTEGKSEGNYCYSRDVIKALLILAVRGENAQAYNITNEESHVTIYQMAKMVAEKISEFNIKVVFDVPASNLYGYARDTKMFLDSTKMRSLGWMPEISLEDAYRRLIGSIKCREKQFFI